MKVSARVARIFRSRAHAAVDRYEDPQQTMEYSYRNQLTALAEVRRGIADVATSRHRLELQANELHAAMSRLHQQAEQAIGLDREDLARAALERRALLAEQLDGISSQRDTLLDQERQLTKGLGHLQGRVEAFRARAETIRATYSAAEAQSRIGESLAGLSTEMTDVGLTMQRAEEHARRMQARSSALEDLFASGVLEDPSRPFRDPVQRQLDELAAENQVEQELARLQQARQLGSNNGA
jgi:phage shock protein A